MSSYVKHKYTNIRIKQHNYSINICWFGWRLCINFTRALNGLAAYRSFTMFTAWNKLTYFLVVTGYKVSKDNNSSLMICFLFRVTYNYFIIVINHGSHSSSHAHSLTISKAHCKKEAKWDDQSDHKPWVPCLHSSFTLSISFPWCIGSRLFVLLWDTYWEAVN